MRPTFNNLNGGITMWKAITRSGTTPDHAADELCRELNERQVAIDEVLPVASGKHGDSYYVSVAVFMATLATEA